MILANALWRLIDWQSPSLNDPWELLRLCDNWSQCLLPATLSVTSMSCFPNKLPDGPSVVCYFCSFSFHRQKQRLEFLKGKKKHFHHFTLDCFWRAGEMEDEKTDFFFFFSSSSSKNIWSSIPKGLLPPLCFLKTMQAGSALLHKCAVIEGKEGEINTNKQESKQKLVLEIRWMQNGWDAAFYISINYCHHA